MPPTYSVPHGVVIGLMAGGEQAMFRAVEGAEDKPEWGSADIARLNVNARDTVVGIAASGRTPYVIGALREALARGALTVSLACTTPAPIHDAAEINIAPLTGPEVVEGSTRMKAGTATKLVLNMLSTTVMIKLGKTYGNLMVDLVPSNQKLRERARRIVERVTGLSPAEAQALLDASGDVKTALVVHHTGQTPSEARERLSHAGGSVRRALGHVE
jgi:N-acetylmuramic acid 6-phosphate etherase